MSFQEKKKLVNLFSSVLIAGIYFWYVFKDNPTQGLETEEIIRFWAKTILILIPISIVARIIIAIVFVIGNVVATQEKPPSEDERDKMIELRSMRNSAVIFGIGFLLAMVAIVLDMSVNTMFAIIMAGGVMSEVVENITQIYYYRKGI